jgi:hypothetical protein
LSRNSPKNGGFAVFRADQRSIRRVTASLNQEF